LLAVCPRNHKYNNDNNRIRRPTGRLHCFWPPNIAAFVAAIENRTHHARVPSGQIIQDKNTPGGGRDQIAPRPSTGTARYAGSAEVVAGNSVWGWDDAAVRNPLAPVQPSPSRRQSRTSWHPGCWRSSEATVRFRCAEEPSTCSRGTLPPHVRAVLAALTAHPVQ
jgi:hypothetical protein